jgi:hypothetical protein
VSLQRISAQSADMMEKELLLAVMAYNLVRAIMFQAAQRARIDPRQLSFTYTCNIVSDGYPRVLAARTARQQQQELERIIDLVARCRLPKRTKRHSYPCTPERRFTPAGSLRTQVDRKPRRVAGPGSKKSLAF